MLQFFFLTILNPSYILQRYLENVLNKDPSKSPYDHEVSTKILNMLWSSKLLMKNLRIFLIKICGILTSFTAPIMLDALTDLFKQEDPHMQTFNFLSLTLVITNKNLRWLFCGILVVNNLLSIYFETQYNFHLNKLKYEFKTILQYLIFSKLIKLPNLSSTNNKNSDDEEANVNNLATVDCETIVGLFMNFHQTWSSFLSLCIIIIILFFKVNCSNHSLFIN